MTSFKPRAGQTPLSAPIAFRAVLALFFCWGFLTCLNNILVPHLRDAFALSYTEALLIPVTFFSTCFICAPLSSWIIDCLGYRQTMVVGLLIMGGGALLFLPAAYATRFVYFLAALGVIGAGITFLQAAAGPYVAFLGPQATSPSRFSLALGFNSLGTMVAPVFGGWFILRTPGETSAAFTSSINHVSALTRDRALLDIRGPYLFLGCLLILLAWVVTLSRLPQMRTAPGSSVAAGLPASVLRHKPLLMGAITAFFYAGAEVGIGSFLINYLSLPDVLGVSYRKAALLATFYWGGAVVGRFFGWDLLRRWRVESVLVRVGLGASLLVAISVISHGYIAAIALLAVGLCNALIVPIVVMLAISGLGPLTARASSVMVAANIGAGLVPLAIGMLADHVGVHHALSLTILCYLFVVYYALWGSSGHLMEREPLLNSVSG